MDNVEKGLKYLNQKDAEINVSILFRDFGSNSDELTKHLELLLHYEEIIPQGSVFYRARTIKSTTYGDLSIVDENNQTSLYGFTPDKMLAPPVKDATAGRANKQGESFLYMANMPEVCCAEVRPIFTEMISVFQFILKEDIRVLNLKRCNILAADLLEVEMLKKVMFAFIDPVKNQLDENYLITQFIASYYQSKGFDGIKYGTLNSSNPDSFNLVVFDEKHVTWEEGQKSEVYRVISKSISLQNLTNKHDVIEIKNGYEKLETKDVDEIIRKLTMGRTSFSKN